VVVLERGRHEALIDELRETGCKVHLIPDGDVAPAIAARAAGNRSRPLDGDRRHSRGRDRGRRPEVRRRWRARESSGRVTARSAEALVDAGFDLDRVTQTDDLVSGQDVFVAATGVTTGRAARGVRYVSGGAVTDSIVMRSRSGTVRRIEATHAFDKLEALSGREYR
jgi:fructose-1,6-bisphosphatase II